MTETSASPLRVAVVGCGNMGRNHLRCYARLPGVTIVGAVDPHAENRALAESQFQVPTFADLDDLPAVDAVSIVTPSTTHVDLAARFIAAGTHCMIEKPLALSAAKGARIADLGKAAGVVLAVGHLERFNPAVVALKDHLSELGPIHAVTARRLARAARITDVDVIDDLMVHDIDVVLDLLGRPVAAGAHVDGLRGADVPGFDYATALVSFPGPILTAFSASRMTPIRIRTLEVKGEHAVATANYIAQTLTLHTPGENGTVVDTVIPVGRREPLLDELADFLAAIRTGGTPRVTPDQAVQTLALVEQIKAARRH
ncbi:Gfo/Idh/MocA family oxidoreductase [Zavarzinia compransoris]|uniref:Gfo/Idh/MocA family protein n=1 Tax=Zavarzinia marina TaxID=2911065 RepID=UPI001F338CB4|nr:Gfo/Idh/MocA family oxidoreductase [Zavarzinia marina]MCF4164412.1 Gfo/Idh/MocA family oxidoreductase [Zavarzinia marina]